MTRKVVRTESESSDCCHFVDDIVSSKVSGARLCTVCWCYVLDSVDESGNRAFFDPFEPKT